MDFYLHYRLQEQWLPDKAALVWRVAFFLAEKAQLLFDASVPFAPRRVTASVELPSLPTPF